MVGFPGPEQREGKAQGREVQCHTKPKCSLPERSGPCTRSGLQGSPAPAPPSTIKTLDLGTTPELAGPGRLSQTEYLHDHCGLVVPPHFLGSFVLASFPRCELFFFFFPSRPLPALHPFAAFLFFVGRDGKHDSTGIGRNTWAVFHQNSSRQAWWTAYSMLFSPPLAPFAPTSPPHLCVLNYLV